MWKSAKSRAEERFVASQKKTSNAMQELEKERQRRDAHDAKLKAQRLAKEAADKRAAESAAAEIKSAKTKPASRLPKAHRRQS